MQEWPDNAACSQSSESRETGRRDEKEEAEEHRRKNRQIKREQDESEAQGSRMSEGLLAEIERLPNQLCVGGPAARLQGIPLQEQGEERS